MTRYLTVTDTAKLIRKALRSEFPSVKFSVRSSKYSMGASIDISWTDGPTSQAVDRIAKLYQGATFDGMTDSKNHHDSVLAHEDGNVEVVSYGADFVFVHRTLSDDYLDALAAMIEVAGAHSDEPVMDCAGGCISGHTTGQSWYIPHEQSARAACSPRCAARAAARLGNDREMIPA